MDEINDARLLLLASERLQKLDTAALIPEKQVWQELGLTQEELDAVGEVELE